MEFDADILARHMKQAAIEQKARELERSGFQVTCDTVVEGVTVDILARKNGETQFYNLNYLDGEEQRKHDPDRLVRLRKIARKQGAVLKLMLVRPPWETHVEIENLEDILRSLLWNSASDQCNTKELQDLSYSTKIDDVELDGIHYVRVKNGTIKVKGNAEVSVTLTWEKGAARLNEHFPFSFTVLLDRTGDRHSLEECDIDTTSWSGEADETGSISL